MSTVRFFTSAALRKLEEIAGEAVEYVPRSITVEYDGVEPRCGVWRADGGQRRVCWYASDVSAALIAAHQERYDDEPFWVIDLSGSRARRIVVLACDGAGARLATRTWEFDKDHMPLRERVHTDGRDHAVMVERTYECLDHGVVVHKTEQRPGQPEVTLPRPHRFPIPELAGEPYPCGGTIGRGGPRIVETIQQNQNQGRDYAIYQDGERWRRGLVTRASTRGWKSIAPILDFVDPGVAKLVCDGAMLDRRHQNYEQLAVVEELPAGRTLEDVVLERGVLGVEAAVAIALEVGAVALRAHAAGHPLGGIRPELIYVQSVGGRLAMTQIAHRGPALISQYYGGEAILIEPVYAADFSSDNDSAGLAQLVWYLTTGRHPWLAPDDLRWDRSWNEFRHRRRRRQPWTGPAALGPILEAALFAATPTPLPDLISALARHRAAAAPYRE
jgi:hypothetical protein